MVFTSPSWVPQLPFDPPDSITIAEFMSNEKYGRYSLSKARNPYTCGLTGKTYTAQEVKQRTDLLARAISKKLGFAPNEDTEWDKVVGLFSLNTIDYIPLTHAVHRLSGIVTPASAAYSAPELEHQLRSSGAKALFTCIPLLETALKAAKAVNIPNDRIILLPVPGVTQNVPFATLDDLITEGQSLPELEALKWVKGQGARQVAYLCYSSGTSGLPKAVMISHRNVIANTLQFRTYESVARKALGIETQIGLGLLPFSHIYGLVVIAHCGTYRGDGIIVLPKFELKQFLDAVQRFKINCLPVVPPIVIQVIRNQDLCKKYDLSSVRFVYTGAAPLGAETVEDLKKQYPKWHVGQGYGMTETSTVVCTTSEIDIDVGSSGSLVPGTRGKIVDPTTGGEITEYNKPGELLVQGPSVVLGYLHNERANADTFVWHEDGRWIRTGDEVLVRKSAAGNEHLVIVDRIKELIKVKGHQVAPAELEAHLLTHPAVSDCAVIQVPDDRAGEVPKAYVVRAAPYVKKPEIEVAADICKHVEEHKARHKWLKGGVEFVDIIPKSPSGKILRRLLRDRERDARKARGAKL
ncbi:Acyl-CoA ligase AFT1-1 [Colletotrichum sidae]|uniref:Acyl-CoA ligase AFT1-1 n=1 Tax=Colletotrichum sidae TaxID=1347389 RepID=A0A4R8TPK7_9PEZI|nr:Acyl-CoA ligase AFT1-1 [Colletotrichum sidae]